MKGRYRRKSRAQAQQEITVRQDNFKGGENSDLPASDIGEQDVALLENGIAFPEYVEGRGGSQKYSDTALPGSGTVYSLWFHQTTKQWILHRGVGVYTAPVGMGSWTQLRQHNRADSQAPTVAGDTGAQLSSLFLDHCSTSNTNAGTLYWNLTNSGSTRTLNIYKDSAKTQLVAAGSRVGNGYVNLSQQNSSDMAGNVTITYSGDDTDSGNTLTVTMQTAVDVNGENSMLADYENDAILFTQSQTFLVDLANSVLVYLANGSASRGTFRLPGSGSKAAATPYGYRYVYTYSRITTTAGALDVTKNRINGTLHYESSANRLATSSLSDTSRDYGEYWVASAISGSAANSIITTSSGATSVNPVGYGISAHYTHISLYRTLDIGSAGVDPVSGAGNNPEIYVWVGDYDRTVDTVSDDKTDEELRAALYGGFGLKTRFWNPIPAGEVGAVTSNFLLIATRGESTINYGQIVVKQNIGFYREDVQHLKMDDGIQFIQGTPDMLSIVCGNKMYMASPNSYFNSEVVESVFVLNHLTVADPNIGVTDYGSIAKTDGGGFIAHCSDHSIRVWSGSSWGKDLSSRLVNKIVRQMVLGSVGLYFSGAYHLWYRTDSGQTYNNACLRYGFGRDNGFGWSRCTGSAWVYPTTYKGALVISDTNTVRRAIVLDSPGSAFYWIETFDSYTGSSLSKVYTDKVTVAGVAGTVIVGKVKFREDIGPEESQTIYHQETHGYVRSSQASGFPAAFAISMIGYVDGSATASETLTGLNQKGDWQFWTQMEGRRIQIELNFATSGWQLTTRDSHYQAHDKASIGLGPADTAEATSQGELASSLKHWLTRTDADLNRATGTNYTLTGTAPTQVSGPDGKTYGLSFVTGASYTQTDANSYSDFAIVFWLKSMTAGNRILQITGSNSFYLTLTNNTTLSVNGDGSVTLASVASGWHQIGAVRTGGTVTVYQNGASVGTVAVATARGGTSVTINPDAVAMQIYDVRIKNDDIVAASVLYNYNDVVSFSGNKTLPSA